MSNSLAINAVSGTLIKSHPKSFFQYYQLGSPMAKQLSGRNPTYSTGKYGESGYSRHPIQESVVILQTMLVGDQYLMSEIVCEKDYLEVLNNA
ncbi:hypothetical protein SAMN04488013_10739 [Marinilactibacillus psychrotolerans]|nr:hypothetical protein SAMN04488013_10739 [Marinilactibacillus psychrotolerans]